MNKFIRKTAAVMCSVLLSLSALASPLASAEEGNDAQVSQTPASEFMEDDALAFLPSGNGLGRLRRDIQDRVEGMYADDYASLAIGVFCGDVAFYEQYFGETNMTDHIEADENSVYEWGSVTKTLVWVSVMQLWEQGKIDLEADVRGYLPDGFFQHLSYDDPITMLDLMDHCAGWQETTRPIWTDDASSIPSLHDALQEAEPVQIHRPGEVAAYSNYGAAVAGYIVECVSGTDFCEYVHKNILEPLGMEHTAIAPDHSDNAFVYEQRSKMRSYKFGLAEIDLGSCLDYVTIYPAGSATGTLRDLMTFAQALVSDEHPLFESMETQELLFTGTDFYGDSDIPICAHGFWCSEYSVRTYGHNGATIAGTANMVIDPVSKFGAVILCNEPAGSWAMTYVPEYVFGVNDPNKYTASGSAEAGGYYLQSRSAYSGMLKFIPYLTAIPGAYFSSMEDADSGLRIIRTDSETNSGETAVLLGAKTFSDGSAALQQPSMDLIADHTYLLKLLLFTVYMLLAVASVYMLRIRHKLRRHRQPVTAAGTRIMTAGQTARLISVIALLITYVVYSKMHGGIPFTAGAVIGIVQMICIAVCLISAAAAAVQLIRKSGGRLDALRYILHAAGNVLTVCAILYFEMYRFWE